MTAREILAYAITHAPRGVKGGPYEAESGPPGEECDSLRDACRWPTTEADARECAVMYLEDHLSWCGDARVIRIVRARPSEASAVEVLRALVAAWDETGRVREPLFANARVVLAASGPDPMPVVRAAMRRWEALGAVQREQGGSHLRRASLDHEYQTAIADENRECAKYRKAGGK